MPSQKGTEVLSPWLMAVWPQVGGFCVQDPQPMVSAAPEAPGGVSAPLFLPSSSLQLLSEDGAPGTGAVTDPDPKH